MVGGIDDRKVHFQYRNHLRRRVAELPSTSWRARQVPRLAGADPEVLQRHGPRFVLATVLRHPQLAEEYLERLSELNISEERLENLLREILLLLRRAPGLDASGLRLQLTGTNAEAADSLLCATVYAQWPIARPESSIESARRGLTHALDRLMKPALDAELAAAELALANDPSNENFKRIQQLKASQDNEAELAELADGDPLGGAFDHGRGRKA